MIYTLSLHDALPILELFDGGTVKQALSCELRSRDVPGTPPLPVATPHNNDAFDEVRLVRMNSKDYPQCG